MADDVIQSFNGSPVADTAGAAAGQEPDRLTAQQAKLLIQEAGVLMAGHRLRNEQDTLPANQAASNFAHTGECSTAAESARSLQ